MAGDGHPRQMTISRASQAAGTELGLRLDQRRPPDERAEGRLSLRPAISQYAGLPFPRPTTGGIRCRHISLAWRALRRRAGAAHRTGAPVTARYRIDQTADPGDRRHRRGEGQAEHLLLHLQLLTLTLTDSAGGKVDAGRGRFDAGRQHRARSRPPSSTAPGAPSSTPSSSKPESRLRLSRAAPPPPRRRYRGSSPTSSPGSSLASRWASSGPTPRSRTTAPAPTASSSSGSRPTRRPAEREAGPRKAVRITAGLHLDRGGHASRRRSGPAESKAPATGAGTYFVSPDGRYLGGDWQLHSSLQHLGLVRQEPVPITITQTTKVTALK